MNIEGLFDIDIFDSARLIAGEGGRKNRVESISVLEVTGEEIKLWVLQDQLYITSFYAVIQNIEEQKLAIRTLAENGAAGLVICHIDLFLKEINEEVIAFCDALDFPLIVADSNASYIEILNPVLLQLNAQTTESAYRSHIRMQDRLIRFISSRGDLDSIFKTMSKEYGRKIAFLDINQKVLFPEMAALGGSLNRTVSEYTKYEFSTNETKTRMIRADNESYILYPIVSNNIQYGTIIAEINTDYKYSVNMLESFSSICTLVFTQSIRIKEQEIMKKQEYIGDLITWNFRNDDVAINRGMEIGWDITNKNRLLIINLNDIQVSTSNEVTKIEKFVQDILYKGIENVLSIYSGKNAIGYRSDLILVLLEGSFLKDIDKVREIGDEILKYCMASFKGSVSIGMSSYFDGYRAIPEAYTEAMDTARIGRSFLGDNVTFLYEDMGFYGMVKDLHATKKYQRVNDQLKHRLLEFDEANHTDLYITLKSLIYNNMNTEKVAAELYVHKNTINYRKKNIVKVLGYTPWEMPYLFNTIIMVVSEYFD